MPERLGGNAAPSAHQPLISLSVGDCRLRPWVSPASRHSITSSARVRNDSEIVNPSVFAVLRFTISSNLVGN